MNCLKCPESDQVVSCKDGIGWIPLAQEFLAIMYHDGIDVEKDFGKALEFYRQSALSGNASAQFGLAGMYLKGEGGEVDSVQAYLFASLAAAQDFPKAEKLAKKAAKKLSAEQIAEADAAIAARTQTP